MALSASVPDYSGGDPPASLTAVSSGVDSLYVAVHSELKGGVAEALTNARSLGGDDLVPFDMGEDVGSYLLRPHGWRRYPFWLSSPRYELMLGCPHPFPVAYTQLHSAFIHTVGIAEAVAAVERALRHFVVAPRLTASRMDVYADTQGWTPPADADRFVCRARRGTGYRDAPCEDHADGRRLSGFKFGKGAVVARIYDKTLELRGRGEDWPEVLWQDADREAPVWRVEFQYRSKALKALALQSIPAVLAGRDGLWEYGTRWLSLRTPTGSERRSNWPVAPEWEALRSVRIGTPCSPLVPERRRAADELRLIQGFAGYASALAAAWGDDDLDSVLCRAGHTTRRYHRDRGTTFASVADAKRRLRIGL